MNIQHNYTNVNDVRLHYASKGQGHAIIFLHGFPACWYVWKPQLKQFGQTFWAIAPDGRGINRSEKPSDLAAYQIDILAADVVGLADQLGIKEFVLVGHDWGGALAWQVAQNYPERVSHLIVLNAPPLAAFLYALATLSEQREASTYINRLKLTGSETALLAENCALLWQSFAPFEANGIYDKHDRAYFLTAWQKPEALTGALNWYRANIPVFDEIFAAQYMPNDKNIINTPSLLLWGEHEKAFTKQLLELIPDYVSSLKIIEIPGADHWISIEQPDLLYRYILEFVD